VTARARVLDVLESNECVFSDR